MAQALELVELDLGRAWRRVRYPVDVRVVSPARWEALLRVALRRSGREPKGLPFLRWKGQPLIRLERRT